MQWQSPQFLYLILPLCVGLLVLALYSQRRRQRARESFVAHPMWSRVLPTLSPMRFWLKLLLREIAIIFGLIALAGPQFGTQLEQVVPRGSDLYILIDVSRSMLADDVPPSRLERAKVDVSALVNRLDGERVGLIAFAGQAVVKCPLTVDYDSFRRALLELDPNSAPRGGTAIGDAIRKAVEVFDAKAMRDQAVLLITDGDDQESYPLEAATIAAERKVTVFTVGLGDTDKGSRVPQQGTASFVEHDGQQVWSKLNGTLLQEIALKTSGVYIPAGTRAYDLGELYAAHLQGRRGDDSETQQRIRKSERFQIFLAIALFALLADLCISPYLVPAQTKPSSLTRSDVKASLKPEQKSSVAASTLLALCLLLVSQGSLSAGEEQAMVRDGIRLYEQEKYEEAGKEFAAAGEKLDKLKSEQAAVAAFDEACAYHRNGDLEKARDRYLKGGLSQDRRIATASHFNLGTMLAEKARKLAGERPEEVPAAKRQEILNDLKQAVASYRHCLELQTDHVQSRRNLELVRNWIKFYTDRWRELDRQKLRDESNLIAFLEFLMQSETALQQTVEQLPENVPTNAFAEIKRAQDELREEIPTLRDKIVTELLPPEPEQGAAPQPVPEEVQKGIKLLQDWADEADSKMASASRLLAKGSAKDAASDQQASVEELDRIWDAVIPFQPLLAKELSDQTTIAKALTPESVPEVTPADAEVASDVDSNDVETSVDLKAQPPNDDDQIPAPANQTLAIAADDFKPLTESQEKTLRKARLLAPKAEAELARIENQPKPDDAPDPPTTASDPSDPDAASPQSTVDTENTENTVDPEEVKAGLRKAIELAPTAVIEMEAAAKELLNKDGVAAGMHAEEARRILDEIQQAQPKNKQQEQDQQNKDQDQPKENKEEQDNKDQKKDEQQEKSEKDEQPKEEKPNEEESGEEKDQTQTEQEQPKPQQVSQDRIEEALRAVRERQQEKRERDQEARMRIIGPSPVDKDW